MDSSLVGPGLVGLCLAVIVVLYFYNNPLKHTGWFMVRRFINWFPLGMTYAFLYMGRYNLTVSKAALGSMMSNRDFGWIFAIGTWTYAMSFLVNGPLVDKIGGKKGIIIAALGSAFANIAMGVLTYLMVMHQLRMKLVVVFSLVYALNMYFQSYGAVSIIKVKAYWFHVRERGVFGAVFGTLISLGVYFAFDWGGAIVKMSKANPEGNMGWLHALVQRLFAVQGSSVDATWAVFFIPAGLMLFWAVMDGWLIKDTPEEADFPHLDTHDASSGQMHVEFTTTELLRKVFTSRLMILLALVEVVMSSCLFSSPRLAGTAAVLIVMAAIGITSLMSGTAATDFGGRKATATCSGIVDGFAYLGSGLQSVSLGYLTDVSWFWWPVFLMPFAVMGGVIALKIWHELPDATRRYIAEVEEKEAVELVLE